MANDNTNKQIDEIDLLKLGKALLKRWWLLLITMILGGAIAFSYAYFAITPLYQSSALMYVNNNSLDIGSTRVNISNGDLTAANNLIDTYAVILKSRSTLEEVIRVGGLPYSYSQLNAMISADSVGNTAVFKVTTTNRDPEMAAHITNTILEVLPDRIAEIVEGSSVEIVDFAVPAGSPSSPNYKKITAIGAMIGFVLSAAFVTLRFLLDTTIRSEEYLLETYKDIPVLGVIPDLASDTAGGYYYGYGKSYSENHEKED
uniref:Lipopolysaccharide biosynthesis protein n=1 Tax=uncultured bacterium Contig783 TaxID=1393612 RepID=W0FIR2_9BACT|nr:lipopolysaccharide biosynthesis protein [uncultured bacterium Contig783]